MQLTEGEGSIDLRKVSKKLQFTGNVVKIYIWHLLLLRWKRAHFKNARSCFYSKTLLEIIVVDPCDSQHTPNCVGKALPVLTTCTFPECPCMTVPGKSQELAIQ